MKKNSLVLILVVALLLPSIIAAQTSQEAELQSRYYFGSFIKGSIIFIDGSIYTYPLNYDLLMKEIVFSPDENRVMTLAEPGKVKQVEINDHLFVQKKNRFYEQILSDSISLYAFHTLSVSSDKVGAYGMVSPSSANVSYKTVGFQSIRVDLQPNERVNEMKSTVYYLLIKNKLKLIVKPKDVYKLFPKLTPELKQLIENRKLSFKNQDSLVEVVTFINKKLK